MEKALLIIGPPDSGKTQKAKELFGKIGIENAVWINASGPDLSNPFVFGSCTEKTTLIVFDDVSATHHLDIIAQFVGLDHLTVDRQSKPQMTIKLPRIVATCRHTLTDYVKAQTCATFTRRFDILELMPSVPFPSLKEASGEKEYLVTKELDGEVRLSIVRGGASREVTEIIYNERERFIQVNTLNHKNIVPGEQITFHQFMKYYEGARRVLVSKFI